MNDYVDFDNNYGFIDEPIQATDQKVYERNSDSEFFMKFRFPNAIFSNISMPIIFPEE